MTETLARISARRPWLTIALWVVVVLVALVLVDRLLGSATTTEPRLTGNIESNRAEDLLEERLRGPKPVLEVVVVQSDTLTVDDPAFRERVEGLFAELVGAGPRGRGCGAALLPGQTTRRSPSSLPSRSCLPIAGPPFCRSS